jgi:hypothetical protein
VGIGAADRIRVGIVESGRVVARGSGATLGIGTALGRETAAGRGTAIGSGTAMGIGSVLGSGGALKSGRALLTGGRIDGAVRGSTPGEASAGRSGSGATAGANVATASGARPEPVQATDTITAQKTSRRTVNLPFTKHAILRPSDRLRNVNRR